MAQALSTNQLLTVLAAKRVAATFHATGGALQPKKKDERLPLAFAEQS